MKLVFLVLSLFGLIYGQSYYTLYNGIQQSGSVYGYSSCYAISAVAGNTMTVEVVSSYNLNLYVGSSCSTDSYSYLVQTPVDGSRYTAAYQVNNTGNNYFVVSSSSYAGFTIKATTGSYVNLGTNQTYSGYASPSNYLYFSFYSTYDSFDITVTGTEAYFYLKQGQVASNTNYDLSFYVYSSYPQVNSVGPCASNVRSGNSGYWYIAVTGYVSSSFTIDINTPSSSAFNPTSLTTGYNYVLLNYGYNYFQIPASTSGIELTSYDSNYYYISLAPLSSCAPSTWPYTGSISGTQSFVFFPNVSQVISVYNYNSAQYTYLILNQISSSSSGALSLSSSMSYSVAFPGDDTTMAYFSTYSSYPTTLSLNYGANVYVKQGSLPTTSDYDYYYPYTYSQTIDPCSYAGLVQGDTLYIGITYSSASVVSVSSYTSSYSSCYSYSGGNVGLIVGLSVGGFVLISIVVFVIVHFVLRRVRHNRHHSYAPLRKHNYVAATTVPLSTYNAQPNAPVMYQSYVPTGVAVPPPYSPPANNMYMPNSYVPPPYAPPANQQ